MAEEPLGAAYRAINQRARATAEIWGQRIYADFAPSGAAKPYLVYFLMSGAEIHLTTTPDGEFLIGIKVVAETLAQAFTGAGRIEALFNDQGAQDTTAPLDGGADWEISTSTKEIHIHLVEQVSGATPLYHEGHRYRFLMQRT